MIERDTIRLLRECDKGIRMGIQSIDDVYSYALSKKLKGELDKCRDAHRNLRSELEGLLDNYGDEGKEPNMMLKAMSKMKTGLKLAMNDSDSTVADLMTDGCNMGIKSLSKYLNKYKAAEERAKDVAKKLISQEEELAVSMRGFL